MINYENGKKLVTLGFALTLVIVISSVALSFLSAISNLSEDFLPIINITNIAAFLSICITAGGYGIMWLCNRCRQDLATVLMFGLQVMLDFLIPVISYSGNTSWSIGSISWFGILLALAMRVKDKNRMLFLLLGCAGVFRWMLELMPNSSPNEFTILLIGIVNIVCAGLCFLTSRQN